MKSSGLSSTIQAAITSVLCKAAAVQHELATLQAQEGQGNVGEIYMTIDDIPPVSSQSTGSEGLCSAPMRPATTVIAPTSSFPPDSSASTTPYHRSDAGGSRIMKALGAELNDKEELKTQSSPASPLNVPTAAAGGERRGDSPRQGGGAAEARVTSGTTVEVSLSGQNLHTQDGLCQMTILHAALCVLHQSR